MTAAGWVERYRCRGESGVNNDNWKRHYWQYKSCRLGELIEASIPGVVLHRYSNSRTRKYDCMRLKNLATSAEVAVNLSIFRSYSPRKTKLRELPIDEEIVKAREDFLKGRTREARRWQNFQFDGLLRTRPHEVFYQKLTSYHPMPAKF